MLEASPTTRRRDPPARFRRRRLLRRALTALAAAAAVPAAVVLALMLFGDSEAEQVAERFGADWAEQDYAGMYGLLDPDSRAEVSEEEFAESYELAAATATLNSLEPGDADAESGRVVLPVTASTEVFGTIAGDVLLDVGEQGVAWAPHLAFPGLAEGERLRRRTRTPRRADLLARNGTVLAEGAADERTSELGLDAASVAGTIGPAASEEERHDLYARGFPRDAVLGLTGLERIFERELAGTPGGVLLAGERQLASSDPRRAEPVMTTLIPGLQQAAVLGLSRLGGIAVVDVDSGEVRALTGIATTGPQPPGSTYKIITTTAALEAGLVEPSTEFPVETGATIDGVTIRNAHREACGGTFTTSFAKSCNSVFAPLGVEVGAERLVETSERFGINRPPSIPSVEASTMPQPDEIESDLELGSTAIGQGELLMTPLGLAVVSQTIANDGKLIEPSVDPEAAPDGRRVTSRRVADTIEELMLGVVSDGTGVAAAIPGVEVAGKTGTAELGEGKDHAWFTAFAPAGRDPDLAIAVLIAGGGAGGEVAAPVARSVLDAGV